MVEIGAVESGRHAASSLVPLPVSSLAHALAFHSSPVPFLWLFHAHVPSPSHAPLFAACLFPFELVAAAGDDEQLLLQRKKKTLEVPLSLKILVRHSSMEPTKELVKNEAI